MKAYIFLKTEVFCLTLILVISSSSSLTLEKTEVSTSKKEARKTSF